MHAKPFRIQAVLFDFDGTLTRPEALDFPAIKKAIGCPLDTPILEFIDTLPTPEEKKQAMKTLDRLETEAAAESEPNDGAEALVAYLKSKNLLLGVVSRNSLSAIRRAMENFDNLDLADFDVVISRDDPVKPKPSGAGIRLAADRLNIPTADMLMVGDYLFDVEAGQRAGAPTVLITNGTPPRFADPGAVFTVTSLPEIKEIIRLNTPLAHGKLPNDLLASFFRRFSFDDPTVLINPGVGEDIAAIDVDGKEVLVLKSDPITFATDAIGHYAVLINANDIATSGAVPRWFLATCLFPGGMTAAEIISVMDDLKNVCRSWGITLCGGHTEITDAVNRPVITGMMTGTVARDRLIDKSNMAAGDRILLTKGVAVEGTAIIAREFGHRLRRMGLPESEITAAREFLSRIGILDEARIAAASGTVHAMHDVTEGGLATALVELSTAGGHRLRVNTDAVPVYPQTKAICSLLGIHPFGLIGSGSLLICCTEDTCQTVIEDIESAGIPVACIGEVMDEGSGVTAFDRGQPTPWPHFDVDEITRLFREG
jgi:HAD superfamily hydrolase (TIGR01509 family)